MKRKILFSALFILSISLSACSHSEKFSSLSSKKEESSIIEASSDSRIEESSIIETSGDSKIEESSSVESSSSDIGSSFSYDFTEKEEGLTLEQIKKEINKIDPQPEERKKVRYTWHIVEKLTGTYPKMMLNDTQMPEGEIVGDFVSEPRNNNMDTNIKVISGTPVTQMQKYYAQSYTSSITPSGWLGYHSQRRKFLERAQEGEGFEERFYTGPLTLWMRSWGRRPENARMDGIFFSYSEFERVYNASGYCTSLKIKEYTYIKGTMTSFMNGTVNYDGSYEYSLTCGIEYLEE